MYFRLPGRYFVALLAAATLFFGTQPRHSTAADHHWPAVPPRPPVRVALTFDDGPNGAATRKIVDILVRYHVPATFFEVGRSVNDDPYTARYVADHGFLIGNHTWDHSWDIPAMDAEQVMTELQQTEMVITAATGRAPTLMRWPHGMHSPVSDAVAQELHLRPVGWNIDPQDYNTQDPQLLTSRVLGAVADESIILLHDRMQDGEHVEEFHDRRGTIAALPIIIEQLQRRHVQFLTVPQMLDLKFGVKQK